MDRNSTDPEYQVHENTDAAEDGNRGDTGRLNEARDVDEENSSLEINQRMNMQRRAPSEVQELHEENEAP